MHLHALQAAMHLNALQAAMHLHALQAAMHLHALQAAMHLRPSSRTGAALGQAARRYTKGRRPAGAGGPACSAAHPGPATLAGPAWQACGRFGSTASRRLERRQAAWSLGRLDRRQAWTGDAWTGDAWTGDRLSPASRRLGSMASARGFLDGAWCRHEASWRRSMVLPPRLVLPAACTSRVDGAWCRQRGTRPGLAGCVPRMRGHADGSTWSRP